MYALKNSITYRGVVDDNAGYDSNRYVRSLRDELYGLL